MIRNINKLLYLCLVMRSRNITQENINDNLYNETARPSGFVEIFLYHNFMKIDINLVENLEVDGVYMGDYPDFCDAFFCAGNWVKTGYELREHELILLGEQYPEVLNEMAYKSLIP